MNHAKYLTLTEESFLVYRFTSEGPRGLVKKSVTYSSTEIENVYNLGFGDYDSTTDQVNDLSVTNNGDSKKILATVASTLYAFTDKFPKAWVGATGSTPARTRLYRMGITNNLHEILKYFVIFGYSLDEEWQLFIVGKEYKAFLITKKENVHTSWRQKI
jgi:hypothetical protein